MAVPKMLFTSFLSIGNRFKLFNVNYLLRLILILLIHSLSFVEQRSHNISELCGLIECAVPDQTFKCSGAPTVPHPKASMKLGPFRDCCTFHQCRDSTDTHFLYTGVSEKGTSNPKLVPRPGHALNSLYPDENSKESLLSRTSCPLFIPFSMICTIEYQKTTVFQKLLRGQATTCPITQCTGRVDTKLAMRTFRVLYGQLPSDRRETQMDKDDKCSEIRCLEKPVILKKQTCANLPIEGRLDRGEIEALGQVTDCCSKLWHCKPDSSSGLEFMSYEVTGPSFQYFSTVLLDYAFSHHNFPPQCRYTSCFSPQGNGAYGCMHDVTVSDNAITKFLDDKSDCCPVYKCMDEEGNQKYGLIILEGEIPKFEDGKAECSKITCGIKPNITGVECGAGIDWHDGLGKTVGSLRHCCQAWKCIRDQEKNEVYHFLELSGPSFKYKEVQVILGRVKNMLVIVAGNKRLSMIITGNTLGDLEKINFDPEKSPDAAIAEEQEVSDALSKTSQQPTPTKKPTVSRGKWKANNEVIPTIDFSENRSSTEDKKTLKEVASETRNDTKEVKPENKEVQNENKEVDKSNSSINFEKESTFKVGNGECDENDICPMLINKGKERVCQPDTSEDSLPYLPTNENCCPLTYCYDTKSETFETHYVKFHGKIPTTPAKIEKEKYGKVGNISKNSTNPCPNIYCGSVNGRNDSCEYEARGESHVNLPFAQPFVECCPMIKCLRENDTYSLELKMIGTHFAYYELSHYLIQMWGDLKAGGNEDENNKEISGATTETSLPKQATSEPETSSKIWVNHSQLHSLEIGDIKCEMFHICPMLNLGHGKDCYPERMTEVSKKYFPINETCCPLTHCFDLGKGMHETHYVKFVGGIPISRLEIEKEKGTKKRNDSVPCPKISCEKELSTGNASCSWESIDRRVNFAPAKPFLECCPSMKCIKKDGSYSLEIKIISTSFAYYELSHYDTSVLDDQKEPEEDSQAETKTLSPALTTSSPPNEKSKMATTSKPSKKEDKKVELEATTTKTSSPSSKDKTNSNRNDGTYYTGKDKNCPKLEMGGTCKPLQSTASRYVPASERGCTPLHCVDFDGTHTVHYVKYSGLIPSPSDNEAFEKETGKLLDEDGNCPNIKCGTETALLFSGSCSMASATQAASALIQPFLDCCEMIECRGEENSYSLELRIKAPSFRYYEISHYNIPSWHNQTYVPNQWGYKKSRRTSSTHYYTHSESETVENQYAFGIEGGRNPFNQFHQSQRGNHPSHGSNFSPDFNLNRQVDQGVRNSFSPSQMLFFQGPPRLDQINNFPQQLPFNSMLPIQHMQVENQYVPEKMPDVQGSQQHPYGLQQLQSNNQMWPMQQQQQQQQPMNYQFTPTMNYQNPREIGNTNRIGNTNPSSAFPNFQQQQLANPNGNGRSYRVPLRSANDFSRARENDRFRYFQGI